MARPVGGTGADFYQNGSHHAKGIEKQIYDFENIYTIVKP